MDRIAGVLQQARSEEVDHLDEGEFADFYSRTARGLWAYVYRLTASAGDADDIVQEAFLRLLRGGPASGEEHRRYLYRIASNLIVDRWRVAKRREKAGLQHGVPSPDSCRSTGRATVEKVDVARTFAELAPRERALLWLAYVEGETHQEIARALGVKRLSVKMLLFRARRRLRQLLERRGVIPNDRRS